MTPANRIRLRTNPPNVSTPQGCIDLYVGESGSLVQEESDGSVTPLGGGTELTQESITEAIEDPELFLEDLGAVANTATGTSATALGYNNTASGYYSTAVGDRNTASPSRSSAFGYNNTASGYYSTAVGDSNTASSTWSSAFGYNNTASGYGSSAIGVLNIANAGSSSAFGYYNTASGNNSSAVGHRVLTTVDQTQEFGYWVDAETRAGAIRIHGTRMVALTLQNRATEYGDGGATLGSEADNTLMREAYAIRRNGDIIVMDINIGGTVKNITLGTAI